MVRQATTLLKFAKETKNPQLAAVLIEKAADLKSQVDESSMTPDGASMKQKRTLVLIDLKDDRELFERS